MSVPPTRAIEVAREAALRSPCAKSKRGAVLFWNGDQFAVPMVLEVTAAFNGPPEPWLCDGSPDCRQHCGRLCMHAEARCLSAAARIGLHRLAVANGFTDEMLANADNYDMLHVKVVDAGVVVPGGPPSCEQCSKAMLEFGIGGMWLYEQYAGDKANPIGEWRRYTVEQFHAESLLNNGLVSAAERRSL
jgi:deoxycytidylate deaminase